jgi:predicted NUDIX family NTP pyrophosphohydrolase
MSEKSKKSAGILLYRKSHLIEFLLVHPGGPFWKNKDSGVWSIPKGEFTEAELPLNAAIREFEEEIGIVLKGDFVELSPIKQKNGKLVFAWALEGDVDTNFIKSNLFELEWPPKSGKKQMFPEINKAQWFGVEEAKRKIIEAQVNFIDELMRKIN